jgi:hypothetical protein
MRCCVLAARIGVGLSRFERAVRGRSKGDANCKRLDCCAALMLTPAREQAEESYLAAFEKRKHINKEKKQVKEQKAEADNWVQMQSEYVRAYAASCLAASLISSWLPNVASIL